MTTITQLNNFCRVFEIPAQYPEGYCFGGGKPVLFKMVDWFNPWPMDFSTGNFKEDSWENIKKLIISFLKEKVYYRPGQSYLVICDFGEAFIF